MNIICLRTVKNSVFFYIVYLYWGTKSLLLDRIVYAENQWKLQSWFLYAFYPGLFGSCSYPYRKTCKAYNTELVFTPLNIHMLASTVICKALFDIINLRCSLLSSKFALYVFKWWHCIHSSSHICMWLIIFIHLIPNTFSFPSSLCICRSPSFSSNIHSI